MHARARTRARRYAMRKQGLREYWADISNSYDWPSLLGFGVIGFLRYRAWVEMAEVKALLREDATDGNLESAYNLQNIAWWAGHEQVGLAIDSLLVYLKVLHYLAAVPYISSFLQTLRRARDQLVCFVVVLAVLVLAFASAFHLALGNTVGAWRGMGTAAIHLLQFILGEVDYASMYTANPALASLLYLLFYFLVWAVAINIFLAIVTDAYAAERKRVTEVNRWGPHSAS